ncbi:iron-containing redox enzyme family protein [Cryobacterium sp. SO2]|uniref:iron-containing redox enzyme family protein n=1 Tax=Cryobacterium sp. SO2 TaxID=1897060 RepID=UPI00223DD17B|nr:iron-containing redox enzyme family protein [Cryobacterium sp. SO2]WEO76446.1 iron-containing redox enzyme family protein [Cryobacterium sp. SO2]
MRIPSSRGPVSSALLELLDTSPTDTPTDLAATLRERTAAALRDTSDVVQDDDLQTALFTAYELRYSGLQGVDDDWEWHPEVLALCAAIEAPFERALRERASVPELPAPGVESVAAALFELTGADSGPSVSRYLAKKATDEQAREFLILRSIYQLKEADPHTWAIPRLRRHAKAALVEIQADEYGGGRFDRMHAELFARTMRGVGLDATNGHYVDMVPAITLASSNMMTMFGTHRRLRGAIAGHLAAFEMTSSLPNRFYGNGFRRLGYDKDVTFYFDEHVEADAVHEQIAARDLAGSLATDEPTLLEDVFFGAAAGLYVDGLAGAQQIDAWTAGTSALRTAETVSVPA